MGKQGAIKEEDQVCTLHIKYPSEHFQVMKAILSDIYSANAEVFPGDIKICLVLDIYGVADPDMQAKVSHLCA